MARVERYVAEIVTARREQIEAEAKCECGSTLARCKSQRGKDPTAPPWFGCCARTLDLLRCDHRPSVPDLLALLREIESGEVKPVEQNDADRLLSGLEEYPSPLGTSRASRRLRARLFQEMEYDCYPYRGESMRNLREEGWI